MRVFEEICKFFVSQARKGIMSDQDIPAIPETERRALNSIQRTFDPKTGFLHHVQVNHRRRHILVSQ